jgi:hypothetical protein
MQLCPRHAWIKVARFSVVLCLLSSWVMKHCILVAIASLAFHRITRFAKGFAARSTNYGLGWVVYVTAVVRSWFSFSAVTCSLVTTSSNISNEELPFRQAVIFNNTTDTSTEKIDCHRLIVRFLPQVSQRNQLPHQQ